MESQARDYVQDPVRSPSSGSFIDTPMKSGVLLFVVSYRAYGNDIAKAFLGGLKQLRVSQAGALLRADLPETSY